MSYVYAGYGVTLCAECGMVSELIAGGGGKLTAFVCVNGQGDVIMQCGRCRQLLNEFALPGMLLETVSGIRTIDEVLPDAFGPREPGGDGRDRQRRGVGRQRGRGRDHRLEFLEQRALDGQVLDHRLDHEVAAGQVGHRRGDAQAGAQGRARNGLPGRRAALRPGPCPPSWPRSGGHPRGC